MALRKKCGALGAAMAALGLMTQPAAAESINFDGKILSVNGALISVKNTDDGVVMWIKAPAAVDSADVGKTAAGACDIRGDMCIATALTVGA